LLLQLERKVDDKDHQRLKDMRREDEKRAARLRDRVRGPGGCLGNYLGHRVA
jgi:hypothetical protein